MQAHVGLLAVSLDLFSKNGNDSSYLFKANSVIPFTKILYHLLCGTKLFSTPWNILANLWLQKNLRESLVSFSSFKGRYVSPFLFQLFPAF